MLYRARNCITVPTEVATAVVTVSCCSIWSGARAAVACGLRGIYGKGAEASMEEAAAPFWLLHRVRPALGPASRRRRHTATWSPRARHPCRMHRHPPFVRVLLPTDTRVPPPSTACKSPIAITGTSAGLLCYQLASAPIHPRSVPSHDCRRRTRTAIALARGASALSFSPSYVY